MRNCEIERKRFKMVYKKGKIKWISLNIQAVTPKRRQDLSDLSYDNL